MNLAVGGVTIAARAAWSLTATAIGGYAFLVAISQPMALFTDPDLSTNPLHALSRMVAFATCSSVVTYFVTQTAGQSQRRHDQLMNFQKSQETNRRLQGLTTLAAGAAHELATPLSTIDVAVRELSRHLKTNDGGATIQFNGSVQQDLRLIDNELDRCRLILGRMRSAAGDSAAERFRQITVGELIDATLEGIRDPHRVDVDDPSDSVEATPLWVPLETVAQAIRNLIHNGLDADASAGRVKLETEVSDVSVRFRVIDGGEGMTEEVLSRIAEPFFTTKQPGRGIGLGLFLTRNVINQLGGEIRFESSLGRGTIATVELPRQNQAGLRTAIAV